MSQITLGQLMGSQNIEPFEEFDLTEVQKVLKSLRDNEAFDIAHAEFLQHRALYAAEILIDMIAKLIKTSGFIESRVNTVKNRAALEYKCEDDKVRVTAEMRKQAGESHPEVEQLGLLLAKTKGAKSALEKKYDVLIKMHYYFKELAQGQKQSVITGTSKSIPTERDNPPKVGW
jgi:DNA polymerase III epsilon subunit-like protein